MEVGVAMTSGVEAKIWGNPGPFEPVEALYPFGKVGKHAS